MGESIPRPPRGSKAGGRRLWNSIVSDYELDEHELTLLREAVRIADRLDALAHEVDDDGVMLDGRAHPALVEARQQQITLARVLAALRMPYGEVGDRQAGARPQRRGGARRPYGITGAVA